MKIFLIVIVVLVLGTVIFLKTHSNFGYRPDETTRAKFKTSPQYDSEKHIFTNRLPDLVKDMRKRAMSFSMLREFFSKGIDREPAQALPEVKPDLVEFMKPSSDLKVIWFGHSTILVNFDQKIILIDPVFSGSAAPFSFMVKRFQKPVLRLEELPPVDYVVISHDHYDHLDMQSMKFFANQKALFITPLGVGSHLNGWGIDTARITELDWWQNHQVAGLEFIATPAQHFSGRDGLHDAETLWASWIIRNSNHSIYFSGDSGYDTHFKAIGEKYGPFDLAFIENGQYNEKWKEVHMLPDQSVQAFFDLKAKRFFPIHWGMFVLALHPWYEPIEKIAQAAKEKNIPLISPKLGEVVTVNDQYISQPWWNALTNQPKTDSIR